MGEPSRTAAERHARAKALFNAAVEAPPAQRDRLLAEVESEEPELAADVRSLLVAEAAAGDFLSLMVGAAAGAALGEDGEPSLGVALQARRRIGPWQLDEPLGEGGMGAVFLAHRADGAFEQRVALKLIRSGLASRQVVERFRQERQALAALSHPSIARLLDGGTTDDGLPYLVMELVAGATIEAHCRAGGLDVAARVDLFLAVCDAVEHAHRNLIVHRDLKPANVLVTADGTPKLLDFGIAKLLAPGGGSGELALTQAAVTVGTVAFASPEQLRGETVSTATDVYSLGVLLYRLLAGVHPYDVNGVPLVEAVRRVAELDPPPPSRAAAARNAAATRALRGDLDNVLLLALRKRAAERYPSVAAFAADLRAWREGRPVSAHRPTARYRAGKFVRRHRLGVAAAAAVLLSLVGGLGAAAWSARVAREEARRARLERQKAERVNEFLTGLLGATDSTGWLPAPPGPRGAGVTVAEVLDAAAGRLDALPGEPAVELAQRRALAKSYSGLGLYERAQGQLRRAVSLAVALYGDSETTGDVRSELGNAYFLGRDYERALPELRRALHIFTHTGVTRWEHQAEVLNAVALIHSRHDTARGLRVLDLALALGRRGGPEGHQATLLSTANVGQLHLAAGDPAGAELALRRAMALETAADRRGWEAAYLETLLGMAVLQRGDVAEAERLLHGAVRHFEASAGPHFVWSARAHLSLGQIAQKRGDLAAAEKAYRDALAAGQSMNDTAISAGGSLGGLLVGEGRLTEAEPVLRDALAAARRAGAAWVIGGMESALGECLWKHGRRAEAAPLLREGYAAVLAAKGPSDPYTLKIRTRLDALGIR